MLHDLPKVTPQMANLARGLRRGMTPEERRLWYDCLKHCPCTVNRQYVIGNYIVDFYCAKASLVIEVDGAQHYDEVGRRKDAERTAYLESLGLRVVRFTNQDIHKRFSDVCRYVFFLIFGES